MAALMILGFELDNYEEWKQVFDSDPAGRRAMAKGHRLSRSVDNPNQVFIGVEYASADDARQVLERLQQSGALDRFKPTVGPTITEVVEQESY